MIVVKDLTIGQLVEFLKIARPEDLQEVVGLTGHGILEEPVNLLTNAKAIIDEATGDLLGIGSCALEEQLGYHPIAIPWMLLTVNVYKHPIAFLRFAKRYLKDLLKVAKVVSNGVAGNELHIKWLTWMGCKWVGEAIPGVKVFVFERGEEEAECVGE